MKIIIINSYILCNFPRTFCAS